MNSVPSHAQWGTLLFAAILGSRAVSDLIFAHEPLVLSSRLKISCRGVAP